MKQKQKALDSPLESGQEIRVRPKVITLNQHVKNMSQGGLDVKEDQLTIKTTLELISRNSEAS